MANYYDSIDFKWTGSGDFALEQGDLADTQEDTLLSLKQEIQTICKSSLGEWEIWPGIGAGLSDFVGEPNVRSTAELIHDRVRIAIISQGIVNEEDLVVNVIPTHRFEVLIIIRVKAIATPYNNLSSGNVLVVSAIYDYLDQGINFLYENPELLLSGQP